MLHNKYEEKREEKKRKFLKLLHHIYIPSIFPLSKSKIRESWILTILKYLLKLKFMVVIGFISEIFLFARSENFEPYVFISQSKRENSSEKKHFFFFSLSLLLLSSSGGGSRKQRQLFFYPIRCAFNKYNIYSVVHAKEEKKKQSVRFYLALPQFLNSWETII